MRTVAVTALLSTALTITVFAATADVAAVSQPTGGPIPVEPTPTYGMDSVHNSFARMAAAGTTKIKGRSVKSRCEGNVKVILRKNGYKVPNYPTASAHGRVLKKRGLLRAGTAPKGAIYYWITGGWGHVAVSDGAGNAINNVGNKIAIRSVDVLNKTTFSKTYTPAGWAYPSDLRY